MASLYTPAGFTGQVGHTPSGTGYSVTPGQTITANDADVAFLLLRGFTVAAPSATSSITVGDGSTEHTNISVLDFVSGATVAVGSAGTIDITIPAGVTYAAGANIDINGGNTIAVKATLPVAVGGTGLTSLTGLMALQSAGAVAITGGTITGMPAPGTGSAVANKTYVDGLTYLSAGSNITISGSAVSVSTIAASSLFGNSATLAGTMSAITIGANLSLNTGGTLAAVAGAGVVGDHGVAVNSGTVQINNIITLAGTAGGTLTITPGSGTSDVLINMPAAGGTVTVAGAPTFARQRMLWEIKQGATAGVLNFGTVYNFTGSVSSFTLSATANAVDRIAWLAPDSSHWLPLAVNQGATI